MVRSQFRKYTSSITGYGNIKFGVIFAKITPNLYTEVSDLALTLKLWVVMAANLPGKLLRCLIEY